MSFEIQFWFKHLANNLIFFSQNCFFFFLFFRLLMGRSPYIVIPHIIEVESNAINQLTFLCKIIQNPPEKKKNSVIYIYFT